MLQCHMVCGKNRDLRIQVGAEVAPNAEDPLGENHRSKRSIITAHILFLISPLVI